MFALMYLVNSNLQSIINSVEDVDLLSSSNSRSDDWDQNDLSLRKPVLFNIGNTYL